MTGGPAGLAPDLSDLLGDGRLLKKLSVSGTGPAPRPGDLVKVHYSCRLAGGDEVLDSSRARGEEPFAFTLGEYEVIPGLEHAVASMQGGERASFTVHPELALGVAGCGGGMVPPSRPSPPNASGTEDSTAVSAASLQMEVDLLVVGRQVVAQDPEDLSQEERLQRGMKAKESGNAEFKAGNLARAAAEYEEALRLLGFQTRDQTGEEEAGGAAPAEDEGQWADVVRREAREKLALSCFLNLAQCELRLELFDAARRHAGSAMTLDPGNSKAIYRRGAASLSLGLLERARADLLEAARREPKSAEVRAKLQECQRKMQSSEQRDRSTFGGMFERGSLSNENTEA